MSEEYENDWWIVYCPVCSKVIDAAPNGVMMEAAGKLHTRDTEHETWICHPIKPSV